MMTKWIWQLDNTTNNTLFYIININFSSSNTYPILLCKSLANARKFSVLLENISNRINYENIFIKWKDWGIEILSNFDFVPNSGTFTVYK